MFIEDDLIEVDHTLPRKHGGKDQFENLQPLHRHCHDVKSARDIDSPVVGADDNSRTVE
jgi:5-methylcytosine-specific restriction endonuclease McrA